MYSDEDEVTKKLRLITKSVEWHNARALDALSRLKKVKTSEHRKTHILLLELIAAKNKLQYEIKQGEQLIEEEEG